MSNWAGFSEEELRCLRNSDPSKQLRNNPYGATQPGSGAQRNSLTSKPRPRHAVQPMKKQTGPPAETTDVPQSAMLSSPKAKDAAESKPAVNVASPTPSVDSKPVNNNPFLSKDESSASPEPQASSPSSETKTSVLLDDSDGRDRDLSTLEQYQQQQKMMEELNKKKKQMLADALAQRQKQATVEAHKLHAIKKELAMLDQMLTADVSVIRDKIEEATRDYADASKRYEQAEKEFVASKVNLHKKNDLKEQLTEHLYTIIHQNEIRKAKKLAELMDKLDLATAQEEDNSTALPLPSYSLLGGLQTVGSGNLVQHSISHDSDKHPACQSPEESSPPTEVPLSPAPQCQNDEVKVTEANTEENLK